MPKERKCRSLSSDRSKAYPYPCSSKGSLHSLPEPPLEDIKEWEEARCPVCMEHPHNAVLLLCSSHDKGCRPFMCDTSYRHSNCLDQFRKSFVENTSPMLIPEEASNSSFSPQTLTETRIDMLGGHVEAALNELGPDLPTPCESEVKQKLVCPLCRGHITGWVVMDCARHFMNSKSRSCACESCDYSGTYADLRNHARVEHPLVRPSVVDPERQNAWRTLERERDFGDVLSTMRSAFQGERVAEDTESFSDGVFTAEEGSLLTVFFLFRVLRPSMSVSSSTRIAFSTSRRERSERPSTRSSSQRERERERTRHWGENFEASNDSPTREDDSGSSESIPNSRRRRDRERR